MINYVDVENSINFILELNPVMLGDEVAYHARIAIVCIPNHLYPVVHVESNIWYEFRGSQRLCTGLSKKWKAENGSKVELVKTVIEDKLEELQVRSFA